jgi:hypothetical protein
VQGKGINFRAQNIIGSTALYMGNVYGTDGTNRWSFPTSFDISVNAVQGFRQRGSDGTMYNLMNIGGDNNSVFYAGQGGTGTLSTQDGTAQGFFNSLGVGVESGKKFGCIHGSNSTCGVVALSSGTATVATTAILSLAAAGGGGDAVSLTPLTCNSCGFLNIGTVTPATSFVIHSSNASDSSSVYWEIRHIF